MGITHVIFLRDRNLSVFNERIDISMNSTSNEGCDN